MIKVNFKYFHIKKSNWSRKWEGLWGLEETGLKQLVLQIVQTGGSLGFRVFCPEEAWAPRKGTLVDI